MNALRRISRALLFGLATGGGLSTALAQTAPAPGHSPAEQSTAAKSAHPKFNPYQSPLATIMQTHLKADVPEAHDFVRESRPDAKTLDYSPLQSQLGPDPIRPKPRDGANISALQAELEASIAHNAARVGHKAKTHRTKAAATAAK